MAGEKVEVRRKGDRGFGGGGNAAVQTSVAEVYQMWCGLRLKDTRCGILAVLTTAQGACSIPLLLPAASSSPPASLFRLRPRPRHRPCAWHRESRTLARWRWRSFATSGVRGLAAKPLRCLGSRSPALAPAPNASPRGPHMLMSVGPGLGVDDRSLDGRRLHVAPWIVVQTPLLHKGV